MRIKRKKRIVLFFNSLFLVSVIILMAFGIFRQTHAAADNSNMVMIDIKKSSNATGWYLTKFGNYYYYKNGQIQKGWLTLNNQKFYLDPKRKGVMTLGWKTIDDRRYYFRKKQQGFQCIGSAKKSCWYKSLKGNYYYFTSNGSLAVLWKKIDGKYYYFRPKAKNGQPRFSRATGWLKSGNHKYYLGSDGVRWTGLKTIDGHKYYFNSSGQMQTGWVTISGKRYYFGSNGALISNYQGDSTAGSNFLWPLPSSYSYISSYFGGRESPGGVGSTDHKGIDIPATKGTPIYAAVAGIIVTRQNASGFGYYIQINHSGSLITEYAHMSKFKEGLKVGSHVEKGQVIGYVGSTGNSTGPHLHFGVMLKGERVDPMKYVKQPN